MGCESNGSTLLCISSCRLRKSWCVQPQVNVIPFNRRLVIASARSDVCGASNSTWSDMFIESTFMRYGHSQGGSTIITVNYKAIAILAHSLHSCSQLVRNLTNVQNELSKDRTHHLEESNARIQADNSDRRKLWERQYQCIDRLDPSGHYVHNCIWKTDCFICEYKECSTNWQGLYGSIWKQIASGFL